VSLVYTDHDLEDQAFKDKEAVGKQKSENLKGRL
jgi:hypothetical protein